MCGSTDCTDCLLIVTRELLCSTICVGVCYCTHQSKKINNVVAVAAIKTQFFSLYPHTFYTFNVEPILIPIYNTTKTFFS